MIESFFKDLRQSLRMFWQSRAFTAAAVAALALGIGANTAIFSVVNAVLLKPVPFPDPERLVLFMTSPQGINPGGVARQVSALPRAGAVVQDVAAFNTGVVNYTGGAFPEQLRSGQVSADFFRLFGAPVLRAARSAPTRICRAATRSSCSAIRSGRADSTAIPTSSARRSRSAATRTSSSASSIPASTSRSSSPSRGVAPVPARSEHHRPGPLLPHRRTPEARRVARPGEGAAEALLGRVHSASSRTRSARTPLSRRCPFAKRS